MLFTWPAVRLPILHKGDLQKSLLCRTWHHRLLQQSNPTQQLSALWGQSINSQQLIVALHSPLTTDAVTAVQQVRHGIELKHGTGHAGLHLIQACSLQAIESDEGFVSGFLPDSAVLCVASGRAAEMLQQLPQVAFVVRNLAYL